jgi:hypothetical protein
LCGKAQTGDWTISLPSWKVEIARWGDLNLMLTTINRLLGFSLASFGEEFGKIKEFYFDDRYWSIRYAVVDTGNWLIGHKVLISPYSMIEVNHSARHLVLNLAKKDVEDGPQLDAHVPVSRQFEETYFDYYGWPVYWNGPYAWGGYPMIIRESAARTPVELPAETWDPDLRSSAEVTGYHVSASDGDIGHVNDFVLDEETWAVRYLVVDTGAILPGKQVLVSPHWISHISFGTKIVKLNLTQAQIHAAPEYTAETLLSRDYETLLHKYYGKKEYWLDTIEPIVVGTVSRL